jgi:hypothetical protein
MPPDLIPLFAQIAHRDVPPGSDLLTATQQLSSGAGLLVYPLHPLTVDVPDIELVADPEEANVTLIVHKENPRVTAALVEERMLLGERVVLVDSLFSNSADSDLIEALLASTVYFSSLAAYDVDLKRTLLAAMIPIREGLAFRRYLANNLIYWWAWRAVVRAELLRRFGETIPAGDMPKAITQARSRVGAHLVRLHRRGLRFNIRKLGFNANRVDGFWFDLQPDQ